ncbi:hypothetical protein [Pleomorphovibrio marinus]|uniref:hypothetical protein n=1 Tax=Pleomorphovibrio marinus TaxID=2164132 RepID=UPI000E0A10C6|nr:hypothetical protein [Pleomorphovibrio marinus]
MKQLIFMVLFGFLVACGGSGNGANSDEVRINFSLDMVMVNPGQEILFLNSGLFLAQLSKDKKYLYNFNHPDFPLKRSTWMN